MLSIESNFSAKQYYPGRLIFLPDFFLPENTYRYDYLPVNSDWSLINYFGQKLIAGQIDLINLAPERRFSSKRVYK